MRRVKYFTKDQLLKANDAAIEAGRNRAFDEDELIAVLKRRPPGVPKGQRTRYPIVFSMIHNDCEIRAGIVLDEEGQMGFLDMSIEDYEALPSAEVDTDAELHLVNLEWKETQ